MSEIVIRQACGSSEIELARALFLEYAKSLDFSLCFQNFDQELAGLPGDYAAPNGRLLLAFRHSEAQGCVALRPLDEGACEMKRLFVRPSGRGAGLGRALTLRVINEAREIRYRVMRLDTIATKMQQAVALYRSLGFREIAPYSDHPIEGTMFMELRLG